MEEPCLPKKLRLELANRVSELLIEIADEPFSEELTEIQREFKDLIISLSQISKPYRYLADSYMQLYEFIKKDKK